MSTISTTTDTAKRGQFSSKFGFIMAAAGSAVGVGNIWGFPTQAASNGGGAFLLVYLVLIFMLGYPMLIAELMIGRHGQTNPANALSALAKTKSVKLIGIAIGLAAIVTSALIFSFYGILSGWFISNTLAPLAEIMGSATTASWLVDMSLSRNVVFTVIFAMFTILVIQQGVEDGIEKWSKRLMPLLFLMLISAMLYIVTQPGAELGVRALLIPDFSRIMDRDVLIGALGQTFFSLSLGSGCMMVYGSYLNKKENIAKLAAQVTLMDTAVAFVAGMVILPAMYVASHNGVEIFAADGSLLSSDTLVFTVLPALFETMGAAQYPVSILFFALLFVAALTSAIGMMESPTSYLAERATMTRKKAAYIVGSIVTALSLVIVFNFSTLFGFVITLTTQYAQPLISLGVAIFAGWVWSRKGLMAEIRAQEGVTEHSIFWKVWPVYVKFVCPVLVLILVFASFQ